ncbi:hypothetical protein ACIBL3_16260 [Kribbella sp. NPDC050124]|uniref:DUF7144 family membrane protein n=1 Tax=Kribbella sp. NPDC050124 TaxID=3364114 RepID=UPI0037B3A62E
MAERRGIVLAGFVAFAGAMLMVIGLVNVFQGFVALVADEELVLTPDNLIVVDVTAWGWTLIISGILLVVVGGGVLTASTWGRIAAIIVVCLHAIVQIAWIGAYPVWAVLMIALDVIVLYSLTARWSDVRDRLGGVGEAPWSGMEGTEEERLTAAEGRQVPPVV